ncbi:MAG: methyltransferase family protein, partial [Thermodesulforhabdaceae bacterium]
MGEKSVTVERLRIPLSGLFAGLLIVLIGISRSRWEDIAKFVTMIQFIVGIILVGIASMGRLWCSLYIAGYKKSRLITQGPYSMCRHPLYFFSFLGWVGVGLTTETFLIPLLITLGFMMSLRLAMTNVCHCEATKWPWQSHECKKIDC